VLEEAKRFFSTSSMFNGVFNTLITVVTAAAILLIAITSLTINELNFWLMLSALTGISQGFISALGSTYVRFLSYSSEGIKIADFNAIFDRRTDGKYESADKLEYYALSLVMRKVYSFVAIIFAVVLVFLLPVILDVSVSALENPTVGWTISFVSVLLAALSIYTSHYRNILLSSNRVAESNRIEAGFKLVSLILVLPWVYAYESLFLLSLAYPLVILGSFQIQRQRCKPDLIKIGSYAMTASVDQRMVFMSTYGGLWRTGTTAVVVNVMKYISPILVGMLYTPAIAAPFLLTKRIFDIIEQVTMAPFNARMPRFVRLRGSGRISVLLPLMKQTQTICYVIFLALFTCLITLGDFLLDTIDAEILVSPPGIIVTIAAAAIVSRWGGMAMLISNQSNRVVEHLQAVNAAIAFSVVLALMYPWFGLYAFPSASLLSVIIVSPLIVKSYAAINTTFLNHEKYIFLSFSSLFCIISAAYLYL
jgi:hypothetical protein